MTEEPRMKERIYKRFQEVYGAEGDITVYFAPGRVNLIGEHTDYNGGHVFPCALTIGTYGAVRKRNDNKLRFYSMNFGHLPVIESSLDDLKPRRNAGWTNYPKGVMWALREKGYELPCGIDLMLFGNIPNGSGLSSSASVEILTGYILNDLFQLGISNQDLALLGQFSENHFNGVNCGIMDQFAIAMGKKDNAIFLDTATLEYEYAPIHLENAKIVIGGATLVGLFSVDGYNKTLADGLTASMSDAGITVLLAIFGVLITGILIVKNVKGNILWGILITWGLGIICQFAGLYVPNAEVGCYSLLPDFSNGLAIPSLSPIFCKLDFKGIFSLDFIVILFAFLFVDLFDTIGTLVGVSSKADMLDKDGKLPRIKGALLADAIATTAGAVLGTSTTTTFVESASGVSEGGRTGLTSVTTAILFGLSLFLSPIFLAIPSFATAPALIIVGLYMLTNVMNIDFSDMSEAIPCYICIIAMPFFYSISEGISMGIIAYVAFNLITGKAKEKKVSVLMYVLAVLFILKYIFL